LVDLAGREKDFTVHLFNVLYNVDDGENRFIQLRQMNEHINKNIQNKKQIKGATLHSSQIERDIRYIVSPHRL
jgi:hypothetical protein